MSYRDALKVFKLERELSDDETAFLNTLRSLSETERELTVAALSPQSSSKKAAKKASKKAAGKSARAASLQSVITGRKQPEVFGFADGTDIARCQYSSSDGPCGELVDDNIHHKRTDPDYHEFVAPAIAAKDDNYQEQAGAAIGD